MMTTNMRRLARRSLFPVQIRGIYSKTHLQQIYTSEKSEQFTKHLYDKQFFLDDPRLSEEEKQQRLLDIQQNLNEEFNQMEQQIQQHRLQRQVAFDEFWKTCNDGSEPTEAVKSMNPMRMLSNIENLVETITSRINEQQINSDQQPIS